MGCLCIFRYVYVVESKSTFMCLTPLDNEAKQRIEPVLKASFISSDESLVEDSDNSNSGSNSEEDDEKSSTAKKLICHKLPWWSVEFERFIASLYRKLDRHRSARRKAMCLKVQDGRDSTHPKPDDLPEWASNWTQLSIRIITFSYWCIINAINCIYAVMYTKPNANNISIFYSKWVEWIIYNYVLHNYVQQMYTCVLHIYFVVYVMYIGLSSVHNLSYMCGKCVVEC